jgi:hypothetical protein
MTLCVDIGRALLDASANEKWLSTSEVAAIAGIDDNNKTSALIAYLRKRRFVLSRHSPDGTEYVHTVKDERAMREYVERGGAADRSSSAKRGAREKDGAKRVAACVLQAPQVEASDPPPAELVDGTPYAESTLTPRVSPSAVPCAVDMDGTLLLCGSRWSPDQWLPLADFLTANAAVLRGRMGVGRILGGLRGIADDLCGENGR